MSDIERELKDTRDELHVYRLASERAIYDAQQFDPSLFLNTDRGVEDVMRRVLARLGEYEGVNRRPLMHLSKLMPHIGNLEAARDAAQAERDAARLDARALAMALRKWKAAYLGLSYRDPDAPYRDKAIEKFHEQDTHLAVAESELLDALSQHGARYLETEK